MVQTGCLFRERMPNTGSIHSTEAVLAADHAGQPESVANSVQPGVTLSVRSVLLVTKQAENLTAVSLLLAVSCSSSTQAAAAHNKSLDCFMVTQKDS